VGNDVPMHLQDVYLTPREIDIVKLLSQGQTTKQVANTLGISPFTVFGTLTRATNRLNANKYNLVYYAHKMGVIE